MPAKKTTKTTLDAPVESAAPRWTQEQLLAVKHMGPRLIGQEMYDAAQAFVSTTSDGKFGPAIISNDPKYNQAGPVGIIGGKPVWAYIDGEPVFDRTLVGR